MLLYCDHYTMRPNGPSRSTSVLKKKRKRNRPTRREEKRKVVTPVRCVQPCVSLTRARYARRPLGRVVVRYYVSQSYTRPSLSVSVLLLTTSSVCLRYIRERNSRVANSSYLLAWWQRWDSNPRHRNDWNDLLAWWQRRDSNLRQPESQVTQEASDIPKLPALYYYDGFSKSPQAMGAHEERNYHLL